MGRRRVIAGNSAVASWLLDEERDRRGNAVEYHYYNDASAGYTVEHYPTRIDYTSHPQMPASRAVVFDYVSTAPHTSYSGGAPIIRTKLLSTIHMLGPEGAEARRYVFEYDTGAGTGRRILTRAWEYAGSVAKPPTLFTWSSHPSQGFARTPTRTHAPAPPDPVLGTEPSASSHWVVTDVTGDGLADIVVSQSTYSPGNGWVNTWSVSPNDGSSLVFNPGGDWAGISSSSYPPLYVDDQGNPVYPGGNPWWGAPLDYDMDGRRDFLLDPPDVVTPNYQVLRASPGGGFTLLDTGVPRNLGQIQVPPPFGAPNAIHSALVADVNGDGGADLVECHNPTLASPYSNLWDFAAAHWTVRFWSPDGPGFETATHPIHELDGRSCDLANLTGNSQIKLVDLDGDHKIDLLVPQDPEDRTLDCASDEAHCTYHAISFLLGDKWSNVDTGLPIPPLFPALGLRYPGTVIFPDVNGDGLPDAVETGFDDGIPRTFMNTGRGFSGPVHSFTAPPLPGGYRHDYFARFAQLIDYNGDGSVDLLMPMRDHCQDPSDQSACWVALVASSLGDGKLSIVDTFIPLDPALDWLQDELAIKLPVRALQAVDVDGDGRHDLVVPEGTSFAVYKSDGPQDLLVSITDGTNPSDPGDPGFLPSVSITYGNLVDTASTLGVAETSPGRDGMTYLPRLDPGNDCTYPRECVVGAQRVVAQYAFNNGANTPRTFLVKYRDGRIDHRGRGFLGFGARLVLDNETGRGTAEFCDNVTHDPAYDTYPFAGHIKRSWSWTPGMVGQFEVRLTSATLQTMPTNLGATYYTLPVIERVMRQEAPAPAFGQSLFAYLQGLEATPATVLSDRYRVVSSYDAYGNILGEISGAAGVDFQEVAARAYDNDPASWLIGLLSTEQVCSTALAETQCRGRSISYNQYGEVDAISSGDPGDPETQLSLGYGHDSFGHVVRGTADDAFGHHRSACVSYDLEQMFPYATRNAPGHTTFTSFDARFGTRSAMVDPNGLVTRWRRDGFGQIVEEEAPDGTTSSVTLTRTKGGGPQGTWWRILSETVAEARGQQIDLYDSFGRLVQSLTQGPEVWACDTWTCRNTPWFERDIQYDDLGRVAQASLPTMIGDPASAQLYQKIFYDGAGRVSARVTPWNSTITYSHAQNVTSTTDSAGTSTVQVDALGRTVQATDKAGKATTYVYGPFSGLRSTTTVGETTTTVRDAYGRVRQATDPNRGASTSHYDGFGELTSMEDARPWHFAFTYDALGRMIQRNDHDGLTGWEYDKAPHGIGKIARTTSPAGHVKEYTYDDLSRAETMSLTLAGDTETLQASFGYDAYGRLLTVAYPQTNDVAPLVVRREYDHYGNVVAVHDNASAEEYWRLDYVDNADRPTLETFGNGITTHHDYYADKGTVQRIVTSLGPTLVQDLRYAFDDRLNVTSRTDSLQTGGVSTEHFLYDSLDRLTCAWFDVSTGTISGTPACSLAVRYLPNGNIDFKSDMGQYAYDPAHPHAVKQAGQPWALYGYDAVGNQSDRPGFTVDYTAFDLPSAFQSKEHPIRMTFDYDGDQRRVRKTTPVQETVYFGDLYERVTDVASGTVKRRFYVSAGSATLVITRSAGQPDEVHYVHPDALGSTDVITDGSGAMVERQSFDAFGRRRNPTWGTGPLWVPTSGVNMGFTGHEPDYDLQVVNMKGRTYDPWVGRFMQTDPIVSRPLFSQAWNAYSYVLNNPLKWVDPSGFEEDGLENPGMIMPELVVGPSPEFLEEMRRSQQRGEGGLPPAFPMSGYPTGQPNASNAAPDPGRDDASLANFWTEEPEEEERISRFYEEQAKEEARLTREHELMSYSLSFEHGQGATAAHMGVWTLRYIEVKKPPTPHMVRFAVQSASGEFRNAAASRKEFIQRVAAGENASSSGAAGTCSGAECDGSICFVAGTLVLTPSGPRPIEELRPGDIILSRAIGASDGEWHAVGSDCVDTVGRDPKLDDDVWVMADGTAPGRHVLLAELHTSARVAFQGKVYATRRGGNGQCFEIRETGETLQRVRQTTRRGTDRLVEVTVRTEWGEHHVMGTPEHPFYVPVQDKFVPMGLLEPGTILLGEGGQAAEVIDVRGQAASSEVFNIEVEETHTYFVCGREDRGCELVHNTCPKDLLMPGGVKIGQAGASSQIRVVQGDVSKAQELFGQLSQGGTPIGGRGYPGTLVKLNGGGTIGLRTVASGTGTREAPVATIDVNIEGVSIREVKFVP